MNVFIIYCHPSKDSFTYKVGETFIEGLKEAGHSYILSDLYAMNFNPVISETQYLKDSHYLEEGKVEEDILLEQDKINQSDVIVFIYPNFWTASPAMLEGWFQRVLSYGYAYGDHPTMKILDKVIFLITMGGNIKEEHRIEQVEAMKTVMIKDRMKDRAKEFEVHVFDEMTRGPDKKREENTPIFLEQVYDIARKL